MTEKQEKLENIKNFIEEQELTSRHRAGIISDYTIVKSGFNQENYENRLKTSIRVVMQGKEYHIPARVMQAYNTYKHTDGWSSFPYDEEMKDYFKKEKMGLSGLSYIDDFLPALEKVADYYKYQKDTLL